MERWEQTPAHHPDAEEVKRVLFNASSPYVGVPSKYQSYGYRSTAVYHGPHYAAYIKRVLGQAPKFMLEVGSFVVLLNALMGFVVRCPCEGV